MTAIPAFITANAQPLILPSDAVNLDIVVPQQIVDNWCWAAVTAALEEFYDVQPRRAQCRIVSDVLGTGSCCPDGVDIIRCNVPHAPQPALRDLFETRVEAPAGTSFSFVESEILAGVPVLANLGFSDGRVGHLVIITGFFHGADDINLIVQDPYTGEESAEPIRRFRRKFRDKGRWRASYKLRQPL
jgi:hypothetical protein